MIGRVAGDMSTPLRKPLQSSMLAFYMLSLLGYFIVLMDDGVKRTREYILFTSLSFYLTVL